MYLAHLTIRNFRQFGEDSNELKIDLKPGVTIFVGRNDSGKSAVIDAIRYVLLTRDREFIRVQPEDFHIDETWKQASEIFLCCKLSGLTDAEKGALLEYLSYNGDDVSVYVNWSARRLSENPGIGRWIDVSVRSGIDGSGPPFETPVRRLMSAAYLRPLRDAESEMSPGRGSRLSQILFNVPKIDKGKKFDTQNIPQDANSVAALSLVGLTDYMRHQIGRHGSIRDAESAINQQYLSNLSLQGDNLASRIDVAQGGSESARLRQILERLELVLLDSANSNSMGRYGLGSNNLLFMACELLLLGSEPEGLPLLLIEEPEAHLHPQRQLRLMESLGEAASVDINDTNRSVQVLLTTHSPNLASKVPLENIVLMDGGRAYSFGYDQTKLERSDYGFLERFLDVTKANLFFAHGVLIVEGDSEAILLPTLAKLLGRDLTEYGVSVVNVGGKGLRRFSRIFQRKGRHPTPIRVPVACVADLDVMPDCAPEILGLVDGDDDEKWASTTRRWKAIRDFGEDDEARTQALERLRDRLKENDGQLVRTFVADHWTLEYDLAVGGLAEQVFLAATLARNDDPLNAQKKTYSEVVDQARQSFSILQSESGGNKAILSSHIYKYFHTRSASKAISAQYLSQFLLQDQENRTSNNYSPVQMFPTYLIDAIKWVTTRPESAPVASDEIDGDENA